MNHNNTLSAGFEKDQVVSVLLALRDADAIQGWALAHGWSGKNPERLAQYVRSINAGTRPRARRVVDHGYVHTLRQRIESGNDHED